MPLADAMQYGRKRNQTITWADEDGNAIDLTGATLRGKKWDRRGIQTSITGVLTVTNATAGEFTWAYSEYDVVTPGAYMVQFSATYADHLLDPSHRMAWRVFDSADFELISASVSPSASRSPSASTSA